MPLDCFKYWMADYEPIPNVCIPQAATSRLHPTTIFAELAHMLRTVLQLVWLCF